MRAVTRPVDARSRPRARGDVARTRARASARRSVDAETYAALIAERIRARDGRAAGMRGAVYDGALGVVVRLADVRGAVIDLADRGFTRGHAVFDAATVADGRAHLLDEHARRFAANARRAGVCGEALDVDFVRELAMETIRVGGVIEGQVRVYATSGSDGLNFNLCDATEPRTATLYVVAYAKDPVKCAADEDCVGLRAVSSPIPIKSPQYATLKSTNYLQNVHVAQHARDLGDADVGVFLTQSGMIGEAPGANVAFLTPDGTLRTPPSTEVLGGITIARVKELISSNAKALKAVGVKRFDDSQQLSPLVVLGAKEAMLIGSAVNIQGITKWDSKTIGDGSVGPATRLLAKLLVNDMRGGVRASASSAQE